MVHGQGVVLPPALPIFVDGPQAGDRLAGDIPRPLRHTHAAIAQADQVQAAQINLHLQGEAGLPLPVQHGDAFIRSSINIPAAIQQHVVYGDTPQPPAFAGNPAELLPLFVQLAQEIDGLVSLYEDAPLQHPQRSVLSGADAGAGGIGPLSAPRLILRQRLGFSPRQGYPQKRVRIFTSAEYVGRLPRDAAVNEELHPSIDAGPHRGVGPGGQGGRIRLLRLFAAGGQQEAYYSQQPKGSIFTHDSLLFFIQNIRPRGADPCPRFRRTKRRQQTG